MALRLTSRQPRGLTARAFALAVQRSTRTVSRDVRTLHTIAADLVETNLTVGGQYSPGTPVDTGEALAGWVRRQVSLVVITITNAVPYIRPLEYGHSQQAPRGFQRLTARHWRDIVQDARRLLAAGATRGGMYAQGGR